MNPNRTARGRTSRTLTRVGIVVAGVALSTMVGTAAYADPSTEPTDPGVPTIEPTTPAPDPTPPPDSTPEPPPPTDVGPVNPGPVDPTPPATTPPAIGGGGGGGGGAPTTSPPASATPRNNQAANSGLANTGTDVTSIIGLGTALTAGGAFLLVASRRRKRTT